MPIGHAEDQRDHGRDAEAGEQADQARAGIGPEQVFAGARIRQEGHAVDRIGKAGESGQQLVVGVFGQPRGRARAHRRRSAARRAAACRVSCAPRLGLVLIQRMDMAPLMKATGRRGRTPRRGLVIAQSEPSAAAFM